jgi:2-hydroxychromene-2-carboxylate isomerase
MAPVLDFWFDFTSTYSYPAAMRIAPLAREAGVTVPSVSAWSGI